MPSSPRILRLDRSPAIRQHLGVSLPIVWVTTVVLAFALLWDRLPDPMASHWDLSGYPDNAMGKRMFFTSLLALALGAAACARASSRRIRWERGPIDLSLTAAAFVGLVSAFVAVTVVVLNLDSFHPWDAGHLPPLVAFTVVGMAATGALAAGRWARPLDIGPATSPDHLERWASSATNVAMIVIASICAVMTTWGALMLERNHVWPILILGVVALVFGHCSVLIDHRGLTVRFGVLGLPRVYVPREHIALVRATHVDPRFRGGWGYRVESSSQDSTIIVRRGPALELKLKDGKSFTVTVDDADVGATILADLVPSLPHAVAPTRPADVSLTTAPN